MGLSTLTRHALKNVLGHKAGNEVANILDALATELLGPGDATAA